MAGQEPGYPANDGERNKVPGTDEIATMGGRALTAAERKTLIERELAERRSTYCHSANTLFEVAKTIRERKGQRTLDTRGVNPIFTLEEAATLAEHLSPSYTQQELWPGSEEVSNGRFLVRNGVSCYAIPYLFHKAAKAIKEVCLYDLSNSELTLASADVVFMTTGTSSVAHEVVRTQAGSSYMDAREAMEAYGLSPVRYNPKTGNDWMSHDSNERGGHRYYTVYRSSVGSGREIYPKLIPVLAEDVQAIATTLSEAFPSLQSAGFSLRVTEHSTSDIYSNIAAEFENDERLKTGVFPLVSLAVVYNLEDALAVYREKVQN